MHPKNRFVTILTALNRHKTPYLYIAPFFISFALFGLYPLLFSVQLSFSDYKIGKGATWVGLANFQRVIADPLFWISLKNVILLWLGSLPVQIVLGFTIAWLLNGVTTRLRGFLSGAFYLPVVTNLVAVALVFRLMFDDQYGIVNHFLTLFGLPPPQWMVSSQWAPLTTIMLIVWKGLGWYVVYILAALQSVEKVYYEAAKIDGANTFQIIRYVTIPAIRPILLFLITLGTIAGLQIFTEPFVLFQSSETLGGPESSVLTPTMYIYAQGFKYLKFGNASAMAVLLGVIIIGLSALQFRFFGSREDLIVMRSRVIVARVLVYSILVFWLVISLFPFYWMFVSSFTRVEDIFTYPPVLLPGHPTIENYQRLPVLIPTIARNALNSLTLAIFTPLASVFFSSLAGYAFAKFRFKGQRVLFALVIFTQLIPPAAGFIPLFIQMAQFKLIDTLWAIFLPGVVSAFGIFLFRQAIRSVPEELLDAARIDGASSFRIYRSVIIPLVMPIVITQYILGFIGSWNEYLWPLIALRTPGNFTLPIAMASIQGLIFNSPWGAIMAGAVLLTVPSIIIFVVLSRYIVPDLTSGAFK